jgi:hypothetical protein
MSGASTGVRRPPVTASSICATWATSLSPAAREVDQHDLAGQRGPVPADPGQGVGRLERRDDALGAGEEGEGVEHLGVGRPPRSGPGRCRRGGRARARCPGSRGRPRSSGPRAPGRARPGAGSSSIRAPRRAPPGPPRRHRRARRPPAPPRCSSAKPEKMPMAFEPPPTQAVTTSGSRPSSSRHCSRASSPMTRCSSRTIHGYGCGPMTEPSSSGWTPRWPPSPAWPR